LTAYRKKSPDRSRPLAGNEIAQGRAFHPERFDGTEELNLPRIEGLFKVFEE
jgi:hypothetical protein